MDFLSPRRLLLATITSVFVLVCTGQPLPLAPNVDVAVGQRADLVCSYNATNILAITITKVEFALNASESRTSIGDDGQTLTFSILAVTVEDDGTYRCVVTTNSVTQSIIFNLQVREEFALVSAPLSLTVEHGDDAQFSCVYNENVQVNWFRDSVLIGQDNSKYVFSGVGRRNLTITTAGYMDGVGYTCQVTDPRGGLVELSASLELTPPYMPLTSDGEAGQSIIVTTDELKIRCPVSGVPGPMIVYWQFGISINAANITSLPQSDAPYVDSTGRLDFTTASALDTGRYRCTAVDELRSEGGHVFFVEVTHNDNFFLWLQWYMILVYCVVFITILMLIFLTIWFCVAVQSLWCVRVKKVIKRKERVRRTTRPPLSFRPGEPYKESDEYEEEEEEEEVEEEEKFNDEEEIDEKLFEPEVVEEDDLEEEP